jgi:anti-sigma B factor antagonist
MSMSPATLLVFVSDKLACIKIVGRANFNSSMDFKALVNELLEKKFNCFVLDLAECVLMDSTFLGVLAGYGLQMRDAEKNGDGPHPIELMNPNPRIADLLENLGVLHLFRVISGPLPEMAGSTAGQTPVPAATPTREEVVSTCLEAHKLLMEIDPNNVPKFKEVTQFLSEDLKKIKRAGDCGCN